MNLEIIALKIMLQSTYNLATTLIKIFNKKLLQGDQILN